jgi:hypothetical protein
VDDSDAECSLSHDCGQALKTALPKEKFFTSLWITLWANVFRNRKGLDFKGISDSSQQVHHTFFPFKSNVYTSSATPAMNYYRKMTYFRACGQVLAWNAA